MARPLPEGLPAPRHDGWTVTPTLDSHGSTDLKRRRMKAPIASTFQGLRDRVLQMLHAALSPATDPEAIAKANDIPADLYEVCETARLYYAMRGDLLHQFPKVVREAFSVDFFNDSARSFSPEDLAYLTKQWQKFYATEPKAALEAMTAWFVESLYTPDCHDVYTLASAIVGDDESRREQLTRYLDEVQDLCGTTFGSKFRRAAVGGIPKAETAVTLAKALQAQLQRPSPLTAPPRSPYDGLTDDERNTIDRVLHESKILGDNDRNRWESRAHHRWGTATLQTPELEENLTIRRLLRKVVNLDAGVQIGALHRIYTDQKIFRDTRYSAVGSVLIDASGSMGLSADEIYQLVLACPAVTIATYSGDGNRGIIRIVVEGGKLAKNLGDYGPPGGGGNIIDGPALDWLATQRSPRVWVSDGIVTGCDDICALNLFDYVALMCTTHNIYRVPKLLDAQHLVRILNDPRKRRIMLEEHWYMEAQLRGEQPTDLVGA